MGNRVVKRVNNVPKVLRNIKGMRGARAGYLKETTANQQYENGLNVATNAFYQENGTRTKDGSRHIPARPFMSYGAKEFAKKTSKITATVADGVLTNPAKANAKLGVMMQVEIQKSITNGPWDPNAPATIRRKGSSKPLSDTGKLKQAVDSRPL